MSEHERQELAYLEEQLTAEDPELAASFWPRGSTKPPGSTRPAKESLILGLLLIGIGAAVLIAGMALSTATLSLIGVLIAAAGITWKVLHWLRTHYESYGDGHQ
ncbi:DUF3040 domain-containing protein [Arthrobacter monumenti]